MLLKQSEAEKFPTSNKQFYEHVRGKALHERAVV